MSPPVAVTKAALVAVLVQQGGLGRRLATQWVELLLETMSAALQAGEAVKIKGFGQLIVRQRQPRRGRNPKTGASLMLAGGPSVVFRPSQGLRQRLQAAAAAPLSPE